MVIKYLIAKVHVPIEVFEDGTYNLHQNLCHTEYIDADCLPEIDRDNEVSIEKKIEEMMLKNTPIEQIEQNNPQQNNPESVLPKAHHVLPEAHHVLPEAHHVLPKAHHVLPEAHHVLPKANIEYVLQNEINLIKKRPTNYSFKNKKPTSSKFSRKIQHY